MALPQRLSESHTMALAASLPFFLHPLVSLSLLFFLHPLVSLCASLHVLH